MSQTQLVYSQKDMGTAKPVFLLLEPEQSINAVDAAPVIEFGEEMHAKRCLCASCQTLFSIANADGSAKDIKQLRTALYNTNSSETKAFLDDISCPECHNGGAFVPVKKQKDKWVTPYVTEGVAMYRTDSDSGKPEKLATNIMLNCSEISENGEVKKIRTLFSEKLNLTTNNIQVVRSDYSTGKSLSPVICDSDTGYKYLNNDIVSSELLGIMKQPRDSSNIMSLPVFTAYNQLLARDMSPRYTPSPNKKHGHNPERDNLHLAPTTEFDRPTLFGIDPHRHGTMYAMLDGKTLNTPSLSQFSESTPMSEIMKNIMGIKREFAESRMDDRSDIPDLFKHSKQNGAVLTEHHIGSDESNTTTNYDAMSRYINMLVHYPAAFEYACERAQADIENHQFALERKKKENPDFIIKPIPDSAKARLFRQELDYVQKQLAAADDKVLKTIQQSTSAADMRKQLQFFVFGSNENKKISETKTPDRIRLTENNTTMAAPYAITKSLSAAFEKNPIGIANTAYTCHKMGITDMNHVNQLVNATIEHDKLVEQGSKKNNTNFTASMAAYDINMAAGTIAPIRTSDAMSFVRSYVKTHNPTSIVDIYSDNDKFRLLTESIFLYGNIRTNCKIADTPEEIEANAHEIEKSNLRAYLKQKTIQDAYIDFVEAYGNGTVDAINSLAREIKREEKLDEIKDFYTANGIDATMSTYRTELQGEQDPAKMLDEYIPTSQREIVLATRDKKPLFANRSLKEIHDELSHMSKKTTGKNETIEYTEEEKALEGSYDVEGGKYSFHLMKNTMDFIRTATELSNCVANGGYIDSALQKRSYLLYMQNDIGQKVGCIELTGSLSNLRVSQFQGPHDNALEAKYADVAMQWLKDKDIDYSRCRDVAVFGTGQSIYGDHNADYHHDEVDEASQTVVDKNELKEIRKKRYEMAKQIYGVKENGEINIPEAPKDL